MEKKRNVLIISPHPDDEAIGCGGVISYHVYEGDPVEVIFLTSGEKGGHGRSEEETIFQREEEARRAAEILQLTNIEFWHQPDGAVRATKALTERLKKKIEEQNTHLIYVTHPDDAHPDHKAAARLVMSAVRQLNGSVAKPQIRLYEIWTPLQKVNLVVDISSYTEIKREAIRAHKCQCDVLRFDESALALNRYRGEMLSWPGGDYAEVFKAIRF